MNVKEYINSGIVESYVLGLATDAERQEFERLCVAYPEVAEARDAFERLLEAQLLQDATPPPASVKEKLLAVVAAGGASAETVYRDESAPVRRMNPWKWIAAACFVGLLGVGYWAYKTNSDYEALASQQNSLQQQLRAKDTELTTLKADAETLYKPGMKMVSLKGTLEAPQAYTTVYWDTSGTSRDVYLMVNNLPQPASDKQYQLWALLDGKPIDLGVFDMDVREKRLLVRMKNVQNAQAFAITVEKRGRPNQDKPEGGIVVVGNL